MKGHFIQEVTDPEDANHTRNRLGLFCVLYGGVHVDLVEVRRSNSAVMFSGLMDGHVGNASNLLGQNLADAGTVRALQASIDLQLWEHQSKGGNNNGSLPAEASVTLPPSPNGLGWRAGFISPHTNTPAEDPLFFNRIPSNDPEMQSDTMAFFSFLIENKPQDHATPARGRRDRRNQLAAAARAPPHIHRHGGVPQPQQPQPMAINSTQQRTSTRNSTARSRPRATRTASPRRHQRIDEVSSYIEESDEAFENNIDVSGSFESAHSNEYSDDYDDEYGNLETVVSEE